VSNGASIWLSAVEQTLSSVIQARVGLAIAYSIPSLRRHMWLANATAGGLMIVAAGVLHVVG
jgi:hypothetical protein